MAGDSSYNNVSLLLHGDGTDGSTTITDNSPSPKTPTVSGNTQIDTAQSQYGGASILFDGAGDYLTYASDADFELGTTYTLEFWIRPSSVASNFGILHRGFYTTGDTSFDGLVFSLRYLGGSALRCYFYGTNNSDAQFIDTSSGLTADTWTHVAVVRNGTSGQVFFNGTSVGTISSLNTPAASTQTLRIGVWDFSGGSEYFSGHLDDIRITKGVARYTGDFTPPTEAFPNYYMPEIIGSVPITVTPAATLDKVSSLSINGNIPIATTVAATLNHVHNVVGPINVAITPAATLLKNHDAIVGATPIVLTPASGLTIDYISSVAADFFVTELSATAHDDIPTTVELNFIDTTLESFTGWNAEFGFMETTLSSTATLNNLITASLSFFDATLSSTVLAEAQITTTLGFFSSTLTSHGGANVALELPIFGLAATATNDATRITADLGFLVTEISASGTMHARADISLGFVEFEMPHLDIALAAPLFELNCSATESQANAVAYVMNIKTTESSTYTNYPFMNIIHIGGKPYGVVSDGLFLLEGDTDAGTAINGTVTTKETDFGVFQSKSIEAIYLNSDTSTTIQPTVDGVLAPVAYPSSFGGRKVEMARGLEGRYWKFKINNIQKLEGLEINPHNRQRRVK